MEKKVKRKARAAGIAVFTDKALPLLQKSLTLLPGPPSIKELEAQARKRLGRE